MNIFIGFNTGTGKPAVFPNGYGGYGCGSVFGKPQHTAYPYRGVAGMHMGKFTIGELNFYCLNLLFPMFSCLFFLHCVTPDTTK